MKNQKERGTIIYANLCMADPSHAITRASHDFNTSRVSAPPTVLRFTSNSANGSARSARTSKIKHDRHVCATFVSEKGTTVSLLLRRFI